jgi:uncharacterized protein (TIGR03066 family)
MHGWDKLIRVGPSRTTEASMKLLSVVVASCCVFGVSGARAEDKKDSNAEKIVGIWEVTKGESLPVGSTLDLTKDGKLKLVVKQGDKAITVEGTYKVEGNDFKVTMKGPGGKEASEIMQIMKLTDKELVIFDTHKQTDIFKKTK